MSGLPKVMLVTRMSQTKDSTLEATHNTNTGTRMSQLLANCVCRPRQRLHVERTSDGGVPATGGL